MEAWEVLERAAALIDHQGWGRGPVYRRHDGSLCAMQAICGAQDIAYANGLPIEPGTRELARAIGGNWRWNVITWNDARGRTKDEVTSTMRSVAATLKAARIAGTRQHVAQSTDAGVDGGSAALMERMS